MSHPEITADTQLTARKGNRKYVARVRRLCQMSPNELLERSKQALSKQWDRMGARSGTAKLFRHDLSARCEITTRHIETFKKRFFVGVIDGKAASMVAHCFPEIQAHIVFNSQAVCRGNFDLLGYHQLNFGNPIDWSFDPIADRRAPMLHWSEIDALDPELVGDSKVIWELNRHQWFVGLGQAYLWERQEYYAETFARHIADWIKNNPTGWGINWASSLEVSVRLMSWCWALMLFLDSPALPSNLRADIFDSIRRHAEHIKRYLSLYFSPNTHLTGEALGLFYAGVLFPDWPSAKSWRQVAKHILVEQIEHQVHADGCYFEQSTGYAIYTAEIYLQFMILARQNHEEIPPVVAERVQRLLDFLLAMRWPDGSMPAIGDADGGSLLPFASRDPKDCRAVFAIAAVLFKRPDYAWAAQTLAPDTLWLLGADAYKEFAALLPQPPLTGCSQVFADGGYTIMRNSRQQSAHALIFDTGSLGCPNSAGHGHADLLSIQLAVFGQPCLIDPGTFIYTPNPRWRNHFRSSIAHNTIVVDGRNQALPGGPFKWQRRPGAQLRRWQSTPEYDYADAHHHAYDDLPNPVTHRRRILFRKPYYWLVVDELNGAAEHFIEVNYQFAPMAVKLSADGWVTAHLPDGKSQCHMYITANTALTLALSEGERDPIMGWISPHYGCRNPAPQLTCSAQASLPIRIVTLLFPVDLQQDMSPRVTTSLTLQRMDIMFGQHIDVIQIGSNDIVVKRVQ